MNVETFRKLLDRVTRRSSRRIAMAESAIKAIEKTAKWVPAPKPLVAHSSLTLWLPDDETLSWTATNSKRGDRSWNHFLKWYHGRQQSRSFVLEHREGSSMVRRKDIRRYEIRYWEA